MEPLIIQRKEEMDNGWRFIVEIGKQESDKVGFAVFIDKEYWKELTLEKFSPERLIKETFVFLLLKEITKTALIRQLGNSFSLKDISNIYYSYERRIKRALFGTEHPEI